MNYWTVSMIHQILDRFYEQIYELLDHFYDPSNNNFINYWTVFLIHQITTL